MKFIHVTLLCVSSLMLISCGSANKSTSSPNQEPTPTETKIDTPNIPAPTAKLYNASVSKKGLDFSYEAEGKVSVVGKTITVTYENTDTCDNGNTYRQQREELFDLETKTWITRTNQVSNCFQSELPENWLVSNNTEEYQRFTITTEGDETLIKGDALEEDGTVIVDGTLVVRYRSDEKKESTMPTASSSPVVSSEAVLTASDPDSRISLRANPSESGKSLGYGLVGDQVQVVEQTTTQSYTWYKVRFPRSGAVGWIRGDFIELKTN